MKPVGFKVEFDREGEVIPSWYSTVLLDYGLLYAIQDLSCFMVKGAIAHHPDIIRHRHTSIHGSHSNLMSCNPSSIAMRGPISVGHRRQASCDPFIRRIVAPDTFFQKNQNV